MMKFKKIVMMTICTIFINGCVNSALTQLTGETHSLYKIGENGPNGGKIFYLDDTGDHGLEAKIADEPYPLPWHDAIAKVKAYAAKCLLCLVGERPPRSTSMAAVIALTAACRGAEANASIVQIHSHGGGPDATPCWETAGR